MDGGGLSTFSGSTANAPDFIIENCGFSKNKAINNGSAFWSGMQGENISIEMKNCQFTENTAINFSAAADFWGTNGATGSVTVDSCYFENNKSGFSGALEMGNGYSGGASVSYILSNSSFLSNEATEGGAVGLWNDNLSTTNFQVSNCTIDGNTATSKGGGIMFNPQGNGYHATVKNSIITNNESPDGGAIDIYQFINGDPVPPNASVTIENSLITGNISDNAAISLERLANFNLLNLTIADNSSGGIEIADQTSLTFQNTILSNPNHTEFQALTTDATVTSLGGNLILDNSLAGQMIPTDKQGLDPLFVGSGDYHLQQGSPCVDAGNDDGVTATTDLGGAARIQGGRVDMGAFESPFFSSAKEAVVGEITLSPNPATDFIFLQMPEAFPGSKNISLYDAQGRVVSQLAYIDRQAVQVGHLSSGLYTMKIMDGNRTYIGKFIKQ